jgi:hypothetical protein
LFFALRRAYRSELLLWYRDRIFLGTRRPQTGPTCVPVKRSPSLNPIPQQRMLFSLSRRATEKFDPTNAFIKMNILSARAESDQFDLYPA